MMQFLKPATIGDAQFVSGARAENDHAAWSGATTYAQDARVILTSTHRIYLSMQAGNLNNNPATDDGTWWLDVGPTNRWAMLDAVVGTVTAQASPLTVVLKPGFVTSLVLLDISGTSVTVSMTDGLGGPTVYSRSFDISDSTILADWWEYFYVQINPSTTLIVSDLPPYETGHLSVSIAAAGAAQCGTLAVGQAVDVGDIAYGARIGITDYSRKETDDFGSSYVNQRAFAKRFEVVASIPAAHVDYVAGQFAAIRATPVIWLGGTEYDSLIAFGWLRDWGINIAYPTYSEVSMTIEGLT